MHTPVAINTTTQDVVVADNRQHPLIISFSRRYRAMEPDAKAGTGNLPNPTHQGDRPYMSVIVNEEVLESGLMERPHSYRLCLETPLRSETSANPA